MYGICSQYSGGGGGGLYSATCSRSPSLSHRMILATLPHHIRLPNPTLNTPLLRQAKPGTAAAKQRCKSWRRCGVGVRRFHSLVELMGCWPRPQRRAGKGLSVKRVVLVRSPRLELEHKRRPSLPVSLGPMPLPCFAAHAPRAGLRQDEGGVAPTYPAPDQLRVSRCDQLARLSRPTPARCWFKVSYLVVRCVFPSSHVPVKP